METYIKIDKDKILKNIEIIKKQNLNKHLILDVSNNAFNHGLLFINYLNDIDYLYVNNLDDVGKIRRLNRDIKIIYHGELNEDNIYDLIVNNVIIIIEDIKFLKKININEEINILIYKQNKLNKDIKDFLTNNKYLKIVGFIIDDNENYETKNSKLLILSLNDLEIGNALKLDNLVYGLENKKLFKKRTYYQAFNLQTTIKRIKKYHQKKNIAIINFGYLKGMKKEIKKVFIKNTWYEVKKIDKEETQIIVDKNIKINDIVEITSNNNPLDKYFKESNVSLFTLFNNLPIVYEEDIFV